MVILGHTIIGNGQKHIMVLHELMGDSRNYDPTHPFLDTNNFTYIFVDHRGYGKSKDIQGEYTCNEAALDVSNLITHLQLNEVNLLAHSMSTMIAQRVALNDDRIKQLILITPLTAAGIKMKPEAQEKLLATMKEDKTLIENVVNAASKRYNDVWRDYRIKVGYDSSILEARTGYMTMYLTTDFLEEVKHINIPIKIMVGVHDLPAFHKNNIKKLFEKSYKNFEIEQCLEAGHYPMVECPPYFVSKIESFC